MITACPKRKVDEKLFRSVCLGVQLAIRKHRDAKDETTRETTRPELQQWRCVLFSTECPTATRYLIEHGQKLLELANELLGIEL